MQSHTEHYTLKNGTVMVNLLDYCGDDDFYALYAVLQEVLAPESATYGVDSMCIDGSFVKEGLLVRMCSESAYDQCCFVYDPAGLSPEAVEKIEGWIALVVAALRERLPR